MRSALVSVVWLLASCGGSPARTVAPSDPPAATTPRESATDPTPPRELPAVAVLSPLRAGRIADLRFSPDGRRLALSTGFEELLLFDSADGALRAVLAKPGAGAGALTFSPSGKYLAVAGHDVTLWDLDAGKPARTLEHHESGSRIASVAWSPDGKTIASGYVRKILRWNADTGASLATWTTPGWVRGLRFLPDGALAASDEDGVLTVFEPDGGKRFEVKKLPGGALPYGPVSVSPDGKTLAVGDPLELRDAKTGELRATVKTPTLQGPYAFDPKGGRVAFDRGGSLGFHSTADGHELEVVKDDAPRPSTGFIPDLLDWSADGERLATGLDQMVTLWDARTNKPLVRLMGLPFSRVSNRQESLVWRGDTVLEVQGDFRAWNVKTGALLASVRPDPNDFVGDVAMSPSGERAVVALGMGKLVSLDLATGKTLAEARGPTLPTCARFLSEDRFVVGTEDQGPAPPRDARTLQPLEKEKPVRCYAESLSQAGGHLALVRSETLALVDTRSRALQRKLSKHPYSAGAFSPSGKLVAVSEPAEVKLLSTKTWQTERSFRLSDLPTHYLQFGPTDDQLLIINQDGVEVRSTETGALLARVPATSHATSGVALSPDGKLMARSDLYGLRLDRLADGAVLHLSPLSGGRAAVLSGDGCADGSDEVLTEVPVRAGSGLLDARLIPLPSAGGGARCPGLLGLLTSGQKLPLPPPARLER